MLYSAIDYVYQKYQLSFLLCMPMEWKTSLTVAVYSTMSLRNISQKWLYLELPNLVYMMILRIWHQLGQKG